MVATTVSPSLNGKPRATMLSASVEFFVNTTVPASPLMNFATFWCACQYFWVAIFESLWTPRPTFAR